jgi:hypothetical protein
LMMETELLQNVGHMLWINASHCLRNFIIFRH